MEGANKKNGSGSAENDCGHVEPPKLTDVVESWFTSALELGILPCEFWDMTFREVRSVVSARRNKQWDEANLIRVAVVSVLTEFKFPDRPHECIVEQKPNWMKSKAYMTGLAEIKRKGG